MSFKVHLMDIGLINEAQDYLAMFKQMLELNLNDKSKIQGEINKYISLAKKDLKKNDRIIWFLKYVRVQMLVRLANNETDEAVVNKIHSILSSYIDVERRYEYIMPPATVVDILAHAYSLNIPEIDNYKLEGKNIVEIGNYFKHVEDSMQQKEGTIVYDKDEVGKGLKIIIDFKDGYYWVQLDRPYCTQEGDAMGHCGNKASWAPGDTILSLRKLIKRSPNNESTWLWEPALTFVMDKAGFLGEMKGRSNEKPAKKYHKYIIELLKNDIIEGITEGKGYRPENNFELSDLTTAEQDDVEKYISVERRKNPEVEMEMADNNFYDDINQYFDNFYINDTEYEWEYDGSAYVSVGTIRPRNKYINYDLDVFDNDFNVSAQVYIYNLHFHNTDFYTSKCSSDMVLRGDLYFENCVDYIEFIVNILKDKNSKNIHSIKIDDTKITNGTVSSEDLEDILSLGVHNKIDIIINGRVNKEHPKQGKFTFESLKIKRS